MNKEQQLRADANAVEATIYELENNRGAFIRECLSNGANTETVISYYLCTLADNKAMLVSIEDRLAKHIAYKAKKALANNKCSCGTVITVTSTYCRCCQPRLEKKAPVAYVTKRVRKLSTDLMDHHYYQGGSCSGK